MMDIQIKLDLSMYSIEQIIDFIDKDIITVEEVEESGVAFTFFTDVLHDYIRQIKRVKEQDARMKAHTNAGETVAS